MRGHYDVVKLLTEKGADISRKNKNGYTAAELAGKWRRGKIVQYLRELELKKIAPDNEKDKSGPVKSPTGDDEEEE
jgi:ankyrin repeat protein